MTSLSIIDPQLRDSLQAPIGALTQETLAATREAVLQMRVAYPGGVEDSVERSEIFIGGADGHQIRTVIHRPAGRMGRLPVLLQIHGGGMVMGCPEVNDLRSESLASRLGCVVVSPDYRKAPESPGPGGAEDGYAVLQWLRSSDAEAAGVESDRIVVMGESGGGGVAGGMVLIARDRGGPSVDAQVLLAPMLDDRTGAEVAASGPYGEFVWTAAHNEFCWEAVRGEAAGDDVSPYASPARAKTLAGLPATFIAVGQLDLFFPESMDYARRLSDAGVSMELHVYPGAHHGYSLVIEADVVRRSARDLEDFLRRAFAAA